VALGAMQPLANFLNSNVRRLVWPAPVVVDAVAWVVFLLVAFVVVRLLTRTSPALPIAAGFVAFNLSFWNFWRWLPIYPSSELRRWFALLLWAVITLVLVRLAMKLATLQYTRVFLVIFLGMWTAVLLLSASTGRSELAGGDLPTVAETPSYTFAEKPNVYWLMLDEHARSDELLAKTGSDNSWFGDDLRERGFSVSESSTSSYVQTHLSLTSTLAMDYAWTPGHDYRGEYGLAATVVNGANPVVATFEANGYRYVGAPDGSIEWARCPDPGPDRSCIEPVGGLLSLREPHSYLVWSTPVGSLDLPLTHNDPASVQAGIDQLRTDDQPFFLFAHLLSPHFPYRYETDCSRRAHPINDLSVDHDQHAALYANDVQCLDREIVATVDHILADDPDAVIIVQSDHGSAIDFMFGTQLEDMDPAALDERFAVLNAIRLPESCRGDSIEGEPLVNTFRLVLACLGGEEPDLLEPRHFFTMFSRVQSIEEIPAEAGEDGPTSRPTAGEGQADGESAGSRGPTGTGGGS